MNLPIKRPIIRSDDGELLGYVTKQSNGWTAETIFGYMLARVEDERSAEMIVREEGLLSLQGVWRYYDKDEHAWFPCFLKEVYESRVVVVRTNELGFQDSEHYKIVTIKNPTETVLLKD